MKKIKYVFLLVSLLFLTTGCEEDIIYENINDTENVNTPQILSLQEAQHDNDFNSIVKDFKLDKQIRTNFKNNDSLNINFDYFYKLENQNNKSFTFLIERNNPNDSIIENLVVEKVNDTVRGYIIKYLNGHYIQVNNNLHLNASVIKSPYQGNIQDLWNQNNLNTKSWSCSWVDTYTLRWCSNHGSHNNDNGACDNYGLSDWIITSNYVCGNSGDTPINDLSLGDSGGGGTSGGGGGSSSVGTAPLIPCKSDLTQGQTINSDCLNGGENILMPSDDMRMIQLKAIIEAPLSTLESEESLKERINAVGEYLDIASEGELSDLRDMLEEVTQDDNLSPADLLLMATLSTEAWDLLKGYLPELLLTGTMGDMTTVFDAHGKLDDLRKIEENLTKVAFIPQVKSITGDLWPSDDIQWGALGEILFQSHFLIEIGVGFIPGSSIIDVVDGISNDDYLALTFGIAGLVVDAFGGTIVKAIGKIGKVAYKGFKIFRIVYKYLDIVVDAITLGFKTDLVNGIAKISDDVGNAVAEIKDNVIKLVSNSAKSLIKVGDLKFLDNVTPSPGGNIGKLTIDDKALRIDPQNSDYADDILDIRFNGDPNGNKTENFMQDLLAQDGYEAVPSPHLPSNQGFDNVLIKKDNSGNITDVIINESKQVGTNGNISLSSGVVGCGGCTQMSQDWIQYTIDRMYSSGDSNLIQLATDLENFGLDNITQIVSGVNKQSGELTIINITGF